MEELFWVDCILKLQCWNEGECVIIEARDSLIHSCLRNTWFS